MTSPNYLALEATKIDNLHIIERMKIVLRDTARSKWTTTPISPERDAFLADHSFSAEDIKQYGYAADCAVAAESPDAAIAELAKTAADYYGKRGQANGSGGSGSATASSNITEADEWDRLALALEAQRDAMNNRTKVVADRVTRLAQALRNHGTNMRQQHADRMAEASDLETVADNLEKKYSKTVDGLAPSKG